MTSSRPLKGAIARVLDDRRLYLSPFDRLRPRWTACGWLARCSWMVQCSETVPSARRWHVGRVCGVFVTPMLLVGACASSVGSADRTGEVPAITARYTLVTHESCNLSGNATRVDANGDGKPDVVTVTEGGLTVCQWLDFNFDGVCDTWVYFTPKGQVRRREVDYDRDGRIDETTNYSGGNIQERQRATTLIGKIDTWQFFEKGRLTRAERDTNGDGIVDQWWEYPNALQLACPLIHSDMDGDGRPDPGATVDLCAKDNDREQSDEGFEDFDAPLSETVEDGANSGSKQSDVPGTKARGSASERSSKSEVEK
jgi:hypothetical protein